MLHRKNCRTAVICLAQKVHLLKRGGGRATSRHIHVLKQQASDHCPILPIDLGEAFARVAHRNIR